MLVASPGLANGSTTIGMIPFGSCGSCAAPATATDRAGCRAPWRLERGRRPSLDHGVQGVGCENADGYKSAGQCQCSDGHSVQVVAPETSDRGATTMVGRRSARHPVCCGRQRGAAMAAASSGGAIDPGRRHRRCGDFPASSGFRARAPRRVRVEATPAKLARARQRFVLAAIAGVEGNREAMPILPQRIERDQLVDGRQRLVRVRSPDPDAARRFRRAGRRHAADRVRCPLTHSSNASSSMMKPARKSPVKALRRAREVFGVLRTTKRDKLARIDRPRRRIEPHDLGVGDQARLTRSSLRNKASACRKLCRACWSEQPPHSNAASSSRLAA